MIRPESPKASLLTAALMAAAMAACVDEIGPENLLQSEAGVRFSDASSPTGGTGGTGATSGGTAGIGTAGGPGGTTGAPSTPGGAGGGIDAGPSAGTRLPCAVNKVVVEKCQACHSDPPVGTYMPLVTAAHFQAQSSTDKTKKYFELAKTRIADSTKPMPPITSPQLTAEEKSALLSWLNQGAPGSNESCGVVSKPDAGMPEPGFDAGTEDLTCYKFLAHADGDKTKKFKVGVQHDGYWLFGFQAPWQGTAYAQVFRPVIDNSKVLHHWLLYKEFAVDGTIRSTIGQHEVGELLAGWAPGGISMDFRAAGDVSMELPAESYALELHYNSSDATAEDASGVEVCTKKSATKNIASMSWVGYDQGGTGSYATGLCLDPKSIWTGVCKPPSQEPIHILFMVPHMHQTGRHMKSVINGPNGSRILHDKPFDFNYQTTYATSEVLMPGESITTTCTFSENKCAGQSTTQEMCYNFMYAYPKHALTDNGLEGSFIHGEGACLGQ
jgi:hypothetical protein